MMRISNVEGRIVSVPMMAPVTPYVLSYAVEYAATSLIVRVETDGGIVGWGETKLVTAPEATLEAIEKQFKPLLVGEDPFNVERVLKTFQARDLHLTANFLIAGFETALWDIIGKATGQPVSKLIGGEFRRKIRLCACMGIREPEVAAETAREYVKQGFSTIKTKVGRDPRRDVAAIKAIREAVGGGVELRADANRAYSPGRALRFIKEIEEYDLQYVEQPCGREALEEMAKMRSAVKTPIALNESAYTVQDVLTIVRRNAADVILPDIPPAGGILGVKKIAGIAEAAGIPLVMHCGHDFGVKTAAMLHVVSSTPIFIYANDTTYYGLEDDILKNPLKITDGYMEVPKTPGLGVEVDTGKLDKWSEIKAKTFFGDEKNPEWIPTNPSI